MDRLTKHWGNNYVATNLDYDFLWEMPKKDFQHFEAIIKKLAEYEDLEEEGRLIILSVQGIHPCRNCGVGWACASSDSEGCTSCHDSCIRLKEYNEKYNT